MLLSSIRALLRSPGFTATAIATLALGTAATSAIFSVVNTVLLRPLPVPDAGRLVMPLSTWVNEAGRRLPYPDASPAKFAHWRAETSVLQVVSAFTPGVVNYTGGDVVEQWPAMRVSADFVLCWGITVIRGRMFTAPEDVQGGARVAMISANLWRRRFAGDPRIIGQTISLDGAQYTVIGILADQPALREFGPAPDVFVPLRLDPDSRDEGDYLKVAARLRPGVTLAQAKARVEASTGEYRAKFPNSLAFGAQDGFALELFRGALAGDSRRLLLLLLSAVGLLLLIACTNVANLLLARAAGRRPEIGIRLALGATRGAVVRELLYESLLLAMVAGALGLLLGHAGIRALLAVDTAGLPLVGSDGNAVSIDWRVATFALAVSLLAALLFGSAPAIETSRLDLISILKDRTRGGQPRTTTRALLVVSQTGLAVILLISAALLMRSFIALYRVDRGFEANNVLTLRTSMSGSRFLKSSATAAAVNAGMERLRSVHGVAAASATCCLPLVQGFYGQTFEIAGRPPANPHDSPAAGWVVISPGFFEVFRIPVLRGRAFNARDDARSPQVVVINQRMAQEFWPGKDPLLDRIVIGKGMMKEFENEPLRRTVGIVGDVRSEKLNADPLPAMYVPQAQITNAENTWLNGNGITAWVVRTQADSGSLAPVVRQALRESTGLPVSDVHTMDDLVSRSSGRQRFNVLLMSTFGGCALLLAAVGVYGLMAYTVEQRRHEIGIRLALGAAPRNVRNMVVGQGMRLALAGVAIGLAGAWALSRLIEALLFEVKPRDPLVFLLASATLALVSATAALFPAIRAGRQSPLESVRYE